MVGGRAVKMHIHREIKESIISLKISQQVQIQFSLLGLLQIGLCDLQISQAGAYLFLYLTVLPAIAFPNLAVPSKWGLFLNSGTQLT